MTEDILQAALIREASNVAACRWLGQGGSPGEYADFRRAFAEGARWAMCEFRALLEAAKKEAGK